MRTVDVAVPDETRLTELALLSRPMGHRAGRSRYTLLRETYYDSRDGALRSNGMRLCLRLDASGRRSLILARHTHVTLQGIVSVETVSSTLEGSGLYATLAGASELATRVRDLVAPAALRPVLALDVDRETRELRPGRWRKATVALHLDRILAHRRGDARALHSATLEELSPGVAAMEELARELQRELGHQADGTDTFLRAWATFQALPEASGQADSDVRTVLLLRREGAVALVDGPDGFDLPQRRGSGEEWANAFARELAGDGGDAVEMELVGFTPSRPGVADMEVWVADLPRGAACEADAWLPVHDLLERVGAPRLRNPSLVSALLLLVRSEVGQRLLWEGRVRRGPPVPLTGTSRPQVPPGEDPEDFLEAELSILDFNQRVLELAEDETLPLLERFRFLAIVASNLDEFFVVRVGRLKAEASRVVDGRVPEGRGVEPSLLLDLVAVRARALTARHYACLRQELLPRLADEGVRLRRWSELDATARAELSRRFEAEIFPLLTPRAMTASPGHPFPRLESLGLSLAAVLRGDGDGIVHLALVPIHASLPRFFPVPGGPDLITVEELVAAHTSALFPSSHHPEVHAFRVSRMGDVEIDEGTSASLLSTVEDEVEARPYMPVVRLEVQRSMPREVLAYLLRELRQEGGSESAGLTRGDVFEVDGPLDLRSFAHLAELDIGGGRFAPHHPIDPLPGQQAVTETLGEGDRLVYHPYEAFDGSVGRFLREAAADPNVVAIKLTLYRTGAQSPFADTLLEALRNGKEVSVFVELKARFDEESNIRWTRRLIEAGGHVVYGVVGFKTHAKTALVVRREGDDLRRYVHIGTGNYNSATARFYTDLGILSADPDLGADLADFFNELTGSSGPPVKTYRRLLVAPKTLAQGIELRIAREIEHARAGRPARIQAKLNGLTDRPLVRALYGASAAGVEVDLVVRSVCTLRPGVPGLSDGIRVRSILGRFLEHARIYYFENGGEEEYFIASADWRRRNLRKRVEVAVPVSDAAARERLRRILDTEFADPRAWDLRADGVYVRRAGAGPTTQERAMAGGV